MPDTAHPWLVVARGYLGVEEIPGARSNPTILRFISNIAAAFPEQADYAAGYVNDDTAWCGVAVADWFAEVGIRPAFVKGQPLLCWMWADGWKPWGVACELRDGAVVCFGRHVALVNKIIDADTFEAIGGNQSSPQGGAVTITTRRRSDVLACRWPSDASIGTQPTRPLIKLGDRGPFVSELQKLLGIAVSEVFDDATDAAVRAFQESHGLTVDGEVWNETWPVLLGLPTTKPASNVPHGAEYADQWRRMTIRAEHSAEVDAIARNLLWNKPRYQAVSAQIGVPWYVIAIIHNRESSGSFTKHLHNGDPLTRRTTHEPPDRPINGIPPFTWEESALDALKLKGLDKIKDWPIERIAYECERYNGMGYRNRGVPSAYLYSFSDIYQGGKYIADGVWSATAMDQQCGTMPLLKQMMALDTSIRFTPQPKEKPMPNPNNMPQELRDQLARIIYWLDHPDEPVKPVAPPPAKPVVDQPVWQQPAPQVQSEQVNLLVKNVVAIVTPAIEQVLARLLGGLTGAIAIPAAGAAPAQSAPIDLIVGRIIGAVTGSAAPATGAPILAKIGGLPGLGAWGGLAAIALEMGLSIFGFTGPMLGAGATPTGQVLAGSGVLGIMSGILGKVFSKPTT